jgi:2-methylcitrate dehydratase PrpD
MKRSDAPTYELAAFVSELTFDRLPTAISEQVKDIILDTLASALAGHDAAEVQTVIKFASALGASSEGTVIGSTNLSRAGACLVNGYLVTAVTVCDIHRPSSCHVTPEVVPPALAVADWKDATGPDLIAAIAAGLEVTTRIGSAFDYDGLRGRGWHTPGLTGPFGGAASSGRLLGLDSEQQANAFGFAGSQSAGTYAQLGTPGIKFQQSRGALSGLMSGTLADAGLTAATEILGHPDGGLFAAYGAGDPSKVISDLGDRWELSNISLRAWPVAVHLQCIVTGLMQLLEKVEPTDQVTDIDIAISPTAYKMHGTVDWGSRFRSRLSARFVAAVVARDRECWLGQFTAESLSRPELNSLAEDHVQVSVGDGLPDGQAVVRLRTASAETLTCEVATAKGEPSNRLTHEEIVHKFELASDGRMSKDNAQRIVSLVSGLEQLDSVQPLLALLRQ